MPNMGSHRTIDFEGAEPTANKLFNALMLYKQLQARIFYNTVVRSEQFRAQNMYIKVISAHEGISQTMLADCLSLRRASVTGALQRLERDGFIRRVQDEEDRRIIRVWLTDAGRDIVRQIDDETVKYINCCFTMDKDRAQELISGLDALTGRMKQYIADFEGRTDEANI